MSRGLIRSGAIYALANVLSAGVPFLLLPVLTRALSPAEYSEVVSFFMLVAVCSAVAGLGLQSAVAVRWLDPSQGDPKTYTASAIVLVLISTGLAAAGAALIAPPWIHLDSVECALAAVLAGSMVLQGMRFAVWQSLDRPVVAAALQVASAGLNAGLSLLAVFALHLGGEGRIFGAAAAGMCMAGASIFLLTRGGRAASRASTADARALIRFGLPLAPHALAGALLANADRLAVSHVLGAAALGVYGAASQLGLVLNVMADAVIKAWAPTMYRMLSRDSVNSRLRIVAVTYLSIPLWIGGAGLLWLGYSVAGSLVLGDRYLAAVDLSIWFLLGGAASAVYLNIAGLFFFTSKTEWISAATVSAAFAAVLMAGPATRAFGAQGGAATYLTAQLALLLAAWTLSQRIKPMPWRSPLLALRVLFRRARLA